MRLTIQELSTLLRKNREILTFVDNELSIKVLPPFPSSGGYDFKHSIFVERVDVGNITEESNKDLFKEWFNTISIFKESLRKLLFFEILSDKIKEKDSIILRQYLTNIEPSQDYMTRYNIIFKESGGTSSFDIRELTENRSKYYITLSKGKSIEVIDLKILEPSTKKLILL